MVQRIQSIWLFLATTAFLSMFLFPYLKYNDTNGSSKSLRVSGMYENIGGEVVPSQEFLGLTLAAAIIGLLPLFTIFLYRNRKLQATLCYITIFAILGFTVWLLNETKRIVGNVQLDVQNYGFAILLPSITMLLIVFALKGIRNDEKLIRSTERLRG